MSETIHRFASRGVLLCALLTGCAPKLTGGPARAVDAQLPTEFLAPSAGEDNVALGPWQELLVDEHLSALVGEALANNQELAILEAEIAASKAELRGARGEYIPTLGVQAGAGVEKVGEYTSQGASDLAHDLPEPLGDLHAGFVASWEVDVWGRLRNASKAARYRYLSSIEGRNFAVTRLVAEIADSYFELLALDNQLEVLDANIELQTSALDVLRLQKEAARATELAVQRFQADLLNNRSHQIEIRQQIVETENRLNFLCGRYPQKVARSSEGFLAMTPKLIQAGSPEQLLTNRPDIRAAEADLEAAKLDVTSARAAFYPSIGVEAEVGLEAWGASKLPLTPESLIWGVAGDLMAPLLNRSALRAAYETRNAKQLKAVVDYERTVLKAYTEVSTQLSMVDNMGQSVELREQQVERLQQAIETSNGLFRSARADYLEVLTTRRDALESQMELIEAKKRQMTAMVDSYQALGGGWRPQGDQP